MKKPSLMVGVVASALALCAATDEIGMAVALNDGSGKNYRK